MSTLRFECNFSLRHRLVCLTTGSQPLPKPVLHTVRSSASSFNFQCPLFSLRSSSSLLVYILVFRSLLFLPAFYLWCVCVYVCIYLFIYLFIYFIYGGVCVCVCFIYGACVCFIFGGVCVCVYVFMYVFIYLCMYLFMYVCMYFIYGVCVCVCVCN